MIAASVKDADKVADILLARGADVNQTSTYVPFTPTLSQPTNNPPDNNGQVGPHSLPPPKSHD
jgi:hypothetical protein